ncbi:protein modification by small protein conjugation or removal [Coemansia sp. RSA 1365]|nr:protein modification by small protein conjugation or removal [Coemansia sp. RSA 1365]
MSDGSDVTTAARPSSRFLRQERKSTIDFGGILPQYNSPMCYPTEVDLYEPSVRAADIPRRDEVGQPSVQAKVEVHLPCGYFNIWRPLHDRRVPVAPRLARFFTGSGLLRQDGQVIAAPASPWDSRISYSSADDEYYENGLALPFIKCWDHGALLSRNIFRKVEHDWLTTYLAPVHAAEGEGEERLIVWRFNYSESRRAIERLHAVLGFSLFSQSAGIEWCIRPLSQHSFRKIPIHILSADETSYFPEIPVTERRTADTDVLEVRARIIEQYRGQILAYRAPSDDYNEYIIHTVPALHADLSEFVAGEYGFEVAVSFKPAAEGPDMWQKAQIARQSLRQPVGGRTKEGEDALSRCGLDFRVKLCADVVVPPPSQLLTQALTSSSDDQTLPLHMDDTSCDFTICVCDPENVVGSLQPPIRAHEHVLRAGSDYFAALLSSTMTESATKHVQLENMPYGQVRIAINFLYTGCVPRESSLGLNDWIMLLDVASRLSIPRLHRLCQARILNEAVLAGASTTSLQQQKEASSEGRASYRDYVTYPEPDNAEALQLIASETGAHDLAQALERLVVYYPINICERRIRSGSPNDFVLNATPSFRHNHLHGLHRALDNDRHGLEVEEEEGPWQLADVVQWARDNHEHPIMTRHAFMPGPVVHQEFAPIPALHRHHHTDHDNHDEIGPQRQAGGLFGQLFGNWRITNTQPDAHNEHFDPPSPQPGPAPTPPQTSQPSAGSEAGTVSGSVLEPTSESEHDMRPESER